ncbi:MGA protein, partial [Brachypodius atriceps]|nr:MGA protein [Brachypodius atriceps]
DVQYTDIDYMNRNLDFTLSPRFAGLPALVDKIKSEGMRFIIILDPGISANETGYPAFDRGVAENVFVQWPNSSEIMYSKVWSFLPNVTIDESLPHEDQVESYVSHCAFPDFFRNATMEWWKREIMEVHDNPDPSQSIKFDGLWTDMNEPAAFMNGAMGGCRNELLNYPPYMPKLGYMSTGLIYKTPCMEGQHYLPDGTPARHYDVHSLYGWSQTRATLPALHGATNERGIIITRSTYPSSGKWAGHWLGDNTAAWDQLHKSIIGRWQEKELHSWDHPIVEWFGLGGTVKPSQFRPRPGRDTFHRPGSSEPYPTWLCSPSPPCFLWSFKEELFGKVQPWLSHPDRFVQDRNTWDIDEQFLWGPALLISPVLTLNDRSVNAYFPDARWYDYHTDTYTGFRGQLQNLSAPLDHINLHIRGGYILPWQRPANTTAFSRKNPMGLTVALDDDLFAEGHLYWDDGVRIGTS